MKLWRYVGPWAITLLATAPLVTSANALNASSLIRKLLGIAGLTAAPGQMRSENVEPGNIWMSNVETANSRPITVDGGYLSPIFSSDGRSILALQGEVVVMLPLSGGSPRNIKKVNAALKIVGFDSANTQEIVILTKSIDAPLVSLSLADGALHVLPYDSTSIDQQQLLGKIRNQDRVYDLTKVYLNIERKEGLLRSIEWTDIYVLRGTGKARNISHCDGFNCAHPALSADGTTILYIKSGEAL